MRLILNEKQILDKSLNEGYINKDKPSSTIRTLTKYYFSIGMNKPQIIDTIDKFLIQNLKDYNDVKWQKSIENMVNYIHRKKDFKLLNIENVKITENELNTILKLNNIKYEKFAFSLLVYAKIYNQMNGKDENWVNEEHKYIFSDAKVKTKVNEQGKILFYLKELGLVSFSPKVDSTNIKVNFVDNSSNIALEINDFREFVLNYLRWKGENILNCEECGVLIVPTNNKFKYCPTCAKEIQFNQKKEWDKTKRIRKIEKV